jgi:CheY-like chemotaxis protein
MLDEFQPSPEETKVLIVDDMPINAELLAEIIGSHGYPTVVAKSGREALDKVASEKPDVVLLDVMMPDINGFEVCRRIRATRLPFSCR